LDSILYIGNFLGSQKGFYSGPNQWIVDSLALNNYNVKYTSKKLSKSGRLIDFCKLIIKEHKEARIVLIDTYSTQAFYFAAIASLLCYVYGIKYILILHGGNLPARFVKSRKIVRWMFTHAVDIVSPSDYLRMKSIEALLPEPILISNPIEINQYIFKPRATLQPKLLWVRSLQSIYNPVMAISVVENLKQLYPSILLTMIGPDKENLLPQLEEIVKEKKLEGHVAFTGKLSVKEWTALAMHHDIFINTTHIDNTPVSLLEAMALGLPIVSTNVGGIPYLIQHKVDGMLCADNDVQAMCGSIQLLMNDEELVSTITLNARREIEQNYTSNFVLDSWAKLIDKHTSN
jgi:glycosyltransferase involved in cell wall biosynthesis